MRDLDKIKELVPQWIKQYGVGQFTYERFCQWVVETHPELVVETLASLLRREVKK